jgi:uncharacterized protein
MSTLSHPHPTVVRHGVRDWVAEHPVTSFFVLAYAYSWLLWAAPALGYRHGVGALLVGLGVFGPPAAAMTVVRLTGIPIRGWLFGVLRWRVAPRWYLVALGFPAAFAALMSLEYALVRDELDVGLLGERLAVFVPVLIVCLVLQGGPEEPGWRGFALPRLQEVLTPVRSRLGALASARLVRVRPHLSRSRWRAVHGDRARPDRRHRRLRVHLHVPL